MDITLARNFAIALFIGALVGIDLEKRKASADPVAIGGVVVAGYLAHARVHPDSLGLCTTQVGVTSIVIAALSNTLVKSGMAAALGAVALRGPILGATAAIVASGLAALWLA